MPKYTTVNQDTGKLQTKFSPAISFPLAYITLGHPQYIQVLDAFATTAVKGGAFKKPEGDNVCYFISTERINAERLPLLLQVPALEILDLLTFIEMTPTAYAKKVPSSIPNSTYTDENEAVQTLTWSEWHDETHPHNEINGKHYIPSNAFGGVTLGREDLVEINKLAGAKVLTVAQYSALNVSDDTE